MNKKTKKHISLTGILTIVNVLIAIAIVLIMFFGPKGAQANAKATFDYLVFLITFFQVGEFGIGSIALVLSVGIDLALIIIIALFAIFAAKKSWKSLPAAFGLLVSTALIAYGGSFFVVALREALPHVKEGSLIFIMVVALLIGVSFALSLLACVTGIIETINVREIFELSQEMQESKNKDLLDKISALDKRVKVLENRKYAVANEEVAAEPVIEEAPVVVKASKSKEIIERVPFTDKIRRADKELKNKYEELKAYLLSYGLKSRISIDGDTYRLHTVKYVHVTIAGKKMKVYYALDPKAYENSTTPVKEARAKKYNDVPAYLDVKSDLSVKRAKALIDEVMNKAGISKAK